jgi:UDP-4-amino-4,6-dideoxy-N-acetyl-beta-L-altrosamine N-acetyltransferase
MFPRNECMLRPITDADLRMVLDWRNHPEVRRYMYSQHEISFDEHQRWFDQMDGDCSRRCFIFETEGSPCGVVNFNNIRNSSVADWGFYLAPNSQKGMGILLGTTALNYCFSSLSLTKVCGQAIAYNERSIKLHRSLGFHEEGHLRNQYFDGTSYHDVLCFGMLSQEWNQEK